MSKINTLNSILTDPTSIEVPALSIEEVYELSHALADRLAELQIEHGITDSDHTTEEWDQITDNLLTFIMEHESFHPEQVVMTLINLWRKHCVTFNSETEVFGRMFVEYGKWLT